MKYLSKLLCVLTFVVISLGPTTIRADFKGETYELKFDTSGFNYNRNMDLIEPSALVGRSRNINTHTGSIDTRGGTSHVNTNPLTGVSKVVGTDSNDYTCILAHTSTANDKPITGADYAFYWQVSGTTGEGTVWSSSTAYTTTQITGIYDYQLLNGNQFIIVATNNGDVFKNNTTTIRTGASTRTFTEFAKYDNILYMVDGSTVPHTWNGSDATSTAITSIPASWSGTSYPSWIIPHGSENALSMVAGGCSNTPNYIYISEDGNGDNFSDADVISIRIETEDSNGIVAAAVFGNNLILFSPRRAFLLDDSDDVSANWRYVPAQWFGGVAHQRLVVNTPNDIVCMTAAGDIYSVSTAQEYGDYKLASVSRPAFIDTWIKDKLRLDEIAKFHAIYDKELRAIKFFVVRSGKNKVDTALVYFIDKPPNQAWVIHTNESYNSGYAASASGIVEVSEIDVVYTGDYSGDVWSLETNTRADNGNGYYSGFKTPWLHLEKPRNRKWFKRGWLLAESEGTHIVSVNWWVDGIAQTQTSITMEGNAGVLGGSATKDKLGTFILGGADSVKDKPFMLKETGQRIQFEVFNNGTGKKFSFQQLLIDWVDYGKPED
jgi:hypothetical protein